jgi:fermentation-respiration switch protein FrsA (DUF1100 family)
MPCILGDARRLIKGEQRRVEREAVMNIHESDTILENGVRGTYVRPPGEGRFPAVLLLHGFASDRHEVGGLYAGLAGMLAGRGIASLRIDFRG